MDQLHRKLGPAEKILSTSPSPSKFVKADFRESDYESDYDGRTPPCRTMTSTKFSTIDSGIMLLKLSQSLIIPIFQSSILLKTLSYLLKEEEFNASNYTHCIRLYLS